MESKLKEDVEQNFDHYQNYGVKTEIYNNTWWTVRTVLFRLLGAGALILSIFFMNKGLMTMASFIIINNNRNYSFQLMTAYESITQYITDIKLATERISELYQDDEYELEKFGHVTRKHIKGKIEF